MNNFIFYSPTEFVFGRDTETQTGALVQKYGARKVMIVYGGGSVAVCLPVWKTPCGKQAFLIVCWVEYSLIP